MNDFLAGILNGINSVVHNYGWSIVIFTLLIKVVLLPFDYKSRKSMRRMSKLQPDIAKLQKKYANDKDKLNQKTQELYRKERINPLSGCVPMLITFPVLIAMFGAMRYIANTELAKQVLDVLTVSQPVNEGWLWVKNLWMPDAPFAVAIADQGSLGQIPADVWARVWESLDPSKLELLKGLGLAAENLNGQAVFDLLSQNSMYQAELTRWAAMPELNLIFTRLTIYAKCNGFFILPILAAVTQFVSAATQPQPAAAPAADGKTPGTGKFMKYFFPLFSLYICAGYNAGFALYWVMANVIAWVQGIVLNKVFEAHDQKAAQVTIGEGTVK
ncbi:MAG: YidC/Oxa1 family membrane protein insertase [Clostridia bacterium]|nr:YidC/Oxa1 family membrane protein insertase [Clostridia bacterium]